MYCLTDKKGTYLYEGLSVLDAAWGGSNIVCIERLVAAIMRTAAIYI
jgi:hypothetical protein